VELTEAVIYCRVSTEEQAASGLGLEAQEYRCRSWAEADGLTVVEVVRDEGVSARTLEREGLQRAIALLRPGRVLVAYKLDRLTRTVSDFPTLARMIEAQDGEWATVAERFDTASATGRLVLNVLLALSEHERDQTAERTRLALAAKRQRGERIGTTPLGYVTLPDKSLAVVEQEMAAVSRARELRAQGLTLQAIADQLTQEGFQTKRGGRWYPTTVKRIVEPRLLDGLIKE
jgi:DNA invertase Pin-like site-specific DNA recombinase